MSWLTERELKRRLTTPPGEVPRGLLEKLTADIPGEIVQPGPSDRPREGPRAPAAPLRGYRPGSVVWRIAAVLVLAAGAGWLASRMGRELPSLETTRPQPAGEETLLEAVQPPPETATASTPEAARTAAVPETARPGPETPEPEGRVEAAAEGYVAPGELVLEQTRREETAFGQGLPDAAAEQAAPEPQALAAGSAAPAPAVKAKTRRAVAPSPPVADSLGEASAAPVAEDEDALRVRVRAEDGSALPGAVIELVEGANRHVGLTDPSGATVFREVPPGRYRVEARLEGFGSRSRELEKKRGTTATIDMELPLAAVQEVIVAEARPEEVARGRGEAAPSFGREPKVRHAAKAAPPAAGEASSSPVTVAERRQDDSVPSVFVSTAEDRFSTFGFVADRGSWDQVRLWLERGEAPPAAAVRLEEILNAFDYGDEAPRQGDFALTAEGAPSLYGAPGLELLRLAFTARRLPDGGVEAIAGEVRVQVEFKPEAVAVYRLLGYEEVPTAEGALRGEDVGAVEVETGDALTALYELRLRPGVKETSEVARVRFYWWSVEERWMKSVELPVRGADLVASWSEAPRGLRLAALVAEFAEALRGSPASPRHDFATLAAHARKLAVEGGEADPQLLELAALIEIADAVARRGGKLPRR